MRGHLFDKSQTENTGKHEQSFKGAWKQTNDWSIFSQFVSVRFVWSFKQAICKRVSGFDEI